MDVTAIEQLLEQRIVILDGAMGTMIQQRRLDEAGFRGERFRDWSKDLKGHNDLLNLTQPAVIEEIHRQYLEAGADIIETNTFNSQAISLGDYQMQNLAYELSKAGAECARRATAIGCLPGSQIDRCSRPAAGMARFHRRRRCADRDRPSWQSPMRRHEPAAAGGWP